MRIKRIISKSFISMVIVLCMLVSPLANVKAQAFVKSETFTGNGYTVTFSVDRQWTGAFNGSVKITNTGKTPIENWALKFNLDNDITNIWNATVMNKADGEYIIKNAVWNQDIPVGGTVNFGFTAATKGDINIPDNYDIPTNTEVVPEGEYKADFKVNSSWANGYTATISITNLTNKVIEDWSLEFDFDKDIKNIWNGSIGSYSNNHYSIKNSTYNQNIGANSTITFGFSGTSGNVTSKPSNYKLTRIAVEQEKRYTVAFNLNYNNAPAGPVSQHVTAKSLVTEPTVPTREGFAFAGWYKEPQCTNQFLFNLENIAEDTTLYANWVANDSDFLKIMDTYNVLEIQFAEGDYSSSVTKNVTLLSGGEAGTTVTWTSSNTSLISNAGVVTRPAEESVEVTLTAAISYNGKSMTKDFNVKVIKSTHPEISDLEDYELEDLVTLNPQSEPEVFLQDNGKLESVYGLFSNVTIESPEEAILALYNIKTLMGLTSPSEELKWKTTNSDENGVCYSFAQVYSGIPVYGSEIMVATNAEKKANSLYSEFKNNINVGTTPVITLDQAREIAGKLDGASAVADGGELYVYNLDAAEAKLVWKVTVNINENGISNSYDVLINAADGSIVFKNLLTLSENSIFGSANATAQDELGNTRSFKTSYIKIPLFNVTSFSLLDSEKKISTYDMESSTDTSQFPGRIFTSATNVWNDQASVSAHANVTKVYNYYKNVLGRNSMDGSGMAIKSTLRDGSMTNNACWDGNNKLIRFGVTNSTTSYLFTPAAAADTIGHEFTHGVVEYSTDLESFYQDETGAINEGYADIFGYFAEGDSDPEWLHREDNTRNARALRNMSNPSEFNQPAAIGDGNYHDYTVNTSDRGGVHVNNTIVSHAAYLMWDNGISDKTRLAKLWYRSLLLGYGGSSTFYTVRLNVLKAARDMRMTAAEIDIIKTAFDQVGIPAKPSMIIKGSSTLAGKIVIADSDANLNNNVPLQDATVFLVNNTNPLRSFGAVNTESDGTYYFTEMLTGTYTLSVRKDGYLPVQQTVTLTNKNLDYYNSIIELIPSMYAGVGTASGKIHDSVNGIGVGGLTLKIRSGISTKTGSTACGDITTNADGTYRTPSLDAGYYCIEIVDNRTLEEGKQKYYTTYINVKVLGNMDISNQNGAVSTSLAGDQLRIVLQWGSVPTDLDSHLVGPTSSGSRFHTWYSSKSYSENGTVMADLDLDDTSSYGPETTTIYKPVAGKYTFYVHNYSGSPAMSVSGAYVQVYDGNANIPLYTFYVPQDTGLYWTVFSYDSTIKKITPINRIGTSPIIN